LGNDHLENLHIDRRIKINLKAKNGMESSGSRHWEVAGNCE